MKNVFKVELNFTNTYKKYINAHPAIREVMCLKAMFPDALSPIEPGDMFVGRFLATPGANKVRLGWDANKHNIPAIGFLPLTIGDGKSGSGYYCHPNKLYKKLKDTNAGKEQKDSVEELIKFWEKETIEYKVRQAYPPEVASALPFDDLVSRNTAHPAYPLIRMTGPMYNNNKLVKLGIPGLENLVKQKLEKEDKDSESGMLYKAMLLALELFKDVCKHYINELEELISSSNDNSEISNWKEMQNVLTNICIAPPENMREAMQLVILYGVISGAYSWGRMDKYLGSLYVNDIENKRLTKDKALQLTCSLWQLINDNGAPYDNRVIVGGKGRTNEKDANAFAHIAIEATRIVKETLPQLSLRFYKGQDESLYNHALEAISEGRTFPMLYNDDINIPAVKNAMNISQKDADQYVPYGCGEYAIYKKSVHTPSGVINNLKVLECVLRNGVEPISGRKTGIATGKFEDFKSFDELLNAYKANIEYFVTNLAKQQKIEYEVVANEAPHILWSILYNECIEKGKSVFGGGLDHLGGTLESYGQINAADSLLVIKKLVFDNKTISANKLLKILNNNFEGFVKERKQLLSVPKYGNDNEEADNMLIDIHDHLCNFTRNQAKNVGLDSYLIVVINNLMNTILGENTLASADGRLNNEYMANGNNPMPGRDKSGVTAFLNSIVKPSVKIHAGAVQNMKFSGKMFKQHPEKINALLKTYFQKGAQAMISVVSKNDLEQAMQEPEKWSHLIIRVGGFSSRFVELPEHVQREVLNRTLNE